MPDRTAGLYRHATNVGTNRRYSGRYSGRTGGQVGELTDHRHIGTLVTFDVHRTVKVMSVGHMGQADCPWSAFDGVPYRLA
jgi:hypothetical protein